MKTPVKPLIQIFAILSLASITPTVVADQYWNASPHPANRANSVWSVTSGGGSLATLTAVPYPTSAITDFLPGFGLLPRGH